MRDMSLRRLDLLMLCSLFAVLLDGTRGFSVDLPQQMRRSMVKQCSSCTEHPNFYSTNHKKLCKTSFYSSKDDNENLVMTKSPMQIIHDTMLLNPTKSIYFSLSIIYS